MKGAAVAIGSELVPAFGEFAKAVRELLQTPFVQDLLKYSAQLIRFWAGNEVARAEHQIINLDRSIRGLERTRNDLRAGSKSADTSFYDTEIEKLREQRGALELFIDARKKQAELESRLAAKLAPNAPDITPAAKTMRTNSEVSQFLAGLQRQIDAINQQTIELKFGPEAALIATLDKQFSDLIEKIRNSPQGIPPGLVELFTVLKTRAVEANNELARMRFEFERLQQIGNAFSQDSAEWLDATAEMARRNAEALADIEPQFRELQRSLSIEILPPDQRPVARATGVSGSDRFDQPVARCVRPRGQGRCHGQ